ncbi:GvpL/GvpF family gas vesicle protein [Halalkalicoccus jeotgali]|uniref:Gas-vesicle operon protein gvpF2 n=1 Tax=Halalkalicoccus jeotgali (strain DSM 18796 / CECT 7217 / JCM 14584 / KCTC 4019 / B3) TaxID=795797 RepID=D8J5P0_HALJB|nr:GvpL/GvpF family gas vesicle protein [Halalkalicoccus jeotgali]ADJ15736.1 gas-vesicle operon protein gvpF2 [Halalkalicoccus jeotgali B3]ELY37240.1 gas-vesicle operon protein gvpF2 [Halalkalicoccus jeotgali B3]
MTDDALYVYGVIENEDLDLDIEGVNGAERAYTVSYQSLAAVVSDIDTVEPERSDENVQCHDEVLQTILEHDGGRTVVPMSFGMGFKNKRTLKNVLRNARPVFSRTLREIDGMVELGLKVLTDEDADVDTDEIVAEVEERFDRISVNVVENQLFSDRLVINRSYLVERADREAFNEAVGEFEDDHDELLVQYTGPWAPYNFVDIEITAQR